MKKVDLRFRFNQVTLEDYRRITEFQDLYSKFVKSLEDVYPLMSRLLIEIDNFDKPSIDEN